MSTAPFRVSAADVLKPTEVPLPRLQTFEELNIPEYFRNWTEEELTKGEKVLWLGRPSRNPAVYPSKTILVVIGVGLLVGAVALALFVRGGLLIFPGVLGFLGLVFVLGPKLFNPANTYNACYVITNRRALLLERSLQGPFRKSYLPHELLSLECRPNARVPGAGDLVFEYFFALGMVNSPGTESKLQRTDVPQRVPRGFFYLDNVREVEQIIRGQLIANLEQKLDA